MNLHKQNEALIDHVLFTSFFFWTKWKYEIKFLLQSNVKNVWQKSLSSFDVVSLLVLSPLSTIDIRSSTISYQRNSPPILIHFVNVTSINRIIFQFIAQTSSCFSTLEVDLGEFAFRRIFIDEFFFEKNRKGSYFMKNLLLSIEHTS